MTLLAEHGSRAPSFKIWTPIPGHPGVYDVSAWVDAIDPNTLHDGDVIHRYDERGISSYRRYRVEGELEVVTRVDASDVSEGACRFRGRGEV